MRTGWILALALLTGLAAGDFLPRPAAPAAGAAQSYSAYFLAENGQDLPYGPVLVPVRFPAPASASPGERMRLAFQALCGRPPRGLVTVLKQGCEVKSVGVTNAGRLRVDFARGGEPDPRWRSTTGDHLFVQQLSLTAAALLESPGLPVEVAYNSSVPTDLGSHGIGNYFKATGRSAYLVSAPVRPGEKPDLHSLVPGSAATANATLALRAPLLGAVNRWLSETGRTGEVARQVLHVIPSGDGTLWVTTADPTGLYQVWWNGSQWAVGNRGQ